MTVDFIKVLFVKRGKIFYIMPLPETVWLNNYNQLIIFIFLQIKSLQLTKE